MSTKTAEEAKVLDSLSLDEVHRAFKEALALGTCQGGQRIQFGDFGWGEPICIRFIFTANLEQKQLQAILMRATALGLHMEPLHFHQQELVFSARTMLVKP